MIIGFRENWKINKIWIKWVNWELWLITLDSNWFPKKFEYDQNIATFSNYNWNTVDILIKRIDWTIEEYKNSNIKENKELSLFINTVHALETKWFMHEAWIAVNVLSCWIWLSTFAFTGWASSLLLCWAITARIVTWNTEIWPCKWDIMQCIWEVTVWAWVLVYKWEALDKIIITSGEMYNTLFPSWVLLKWVLKNSITWNEIKNWTLKAVRKYSNESIRWEIKNNWEYEILFKNGWAYWANILSEWFVSTSFPIILSDTKLQVRIPETNIAVEKDLPENDLKEITMDFLIDPEAYIKWEIIDSVEWNSMKNVSVSLILNWEVVDSFLTDSDWNFIIEPTLNKEWTNFTLRFEAKDYKTIEKNIFVSYEVIENSDEYFIEWWNNIIKMEEGKWDWYLSFNAPIIESNLCTSNLITTLAKDISFNIQNWNIKWNPISKDFCPDETNEKNCYRWNITWSWSENGWEINWVYRWFSLFGEWEPYSIKWRLDWTKWSWTWEKQIPKNTSKWEENHYKECNWTWEAVFK
jgi:hypothetical protein